MNGRYGSRAIRPVLTVAGIFAIMLAVARRFLGKATALAGAHLVSHIGRLALAVNVTVMLNVNLAPRKYCRAGALCGG